VRGGTYRNEAERKPEWWNTTEHARSMSHPAVPLAIRSSVRPSVHTYVHTYVPPRDSSRIGSPFFVFALSLRPSHPRACPFLTCGTSRGLSIIIALRARAP